MPAKGAGRVAAAPTARVTRSSKAKSLEREQPHSSVKGAPTPKASTGKRKASSRPEKPEKEKAPEPATKKVKGAQSDRQDDEECFWLMKAEPESRLENGVDVKFSIDDLAAKSEPEPWDGVRNAMAQKNMRNMRVGDFALFYHSNCKVPGVAGIMKIVREQTPDESAFDPKHPYYDPKSKRESPRWIVVHVSFVKKFQELVPLKTLQKYASTGADLENLQTLRMSRLSVSQVSKEEWKFILSLAGEPSPK